MSDSDDSDVPLVKKFAKVIEDDYDSDQPLSKLPGVKPSTVLSKESAKNKVAPKMIKKAVAQVPPSPPSLLLCSPPGAAGLPPKQASRFSFSRPRGLFLVETTYHIPQGSPRVPRGASTSDVYLVSRCRSCLSSLLPSSLGLLVWSLTRLVGMCWARSLC